MKTKDIKTTAKVLGTSWKSNSYYGNPSYWVCFEDENGEFVRAYTATDAACGYSCTNYNGKSCELTYHYTRTGNAIITRMSDAK